MSGSFQTCGQLPSRQNSEQATFGAAHVIKILLHTPRPSATGKTLTVASSNGNKLTDVQINDLPVIVGINAYIEPER